MKKTITPLEKARKELEKIEQKLEKHRAVCADIHGNGTMRKANSMRNWDYYAQEKNRLRALIDDLEQQEKHLQEMHYKEERERENMYCVSCGAMFEMECVCYDDND